ncbi:pyridoxamine 5'-phosphate oxidase family protein [Salinilacihabitans rarus]|uniref:pyridoxamine 5'-phosphate oxidase family protein n=1 Tax=Salinilacihabitans rarus TaxID=2961596 RepID=UPI0020C9337B|nr:pyridoxamine 5'-phosphate oxidase family protein [Salinilacihabitans rarus]
MSIEQETEMTDSEIDALLSRHETGVLALARSDEPYAIPISYGYDPDDRTFYMRLVSTPESEKRRFLASSPAVRLVVYETGEEVYRSVVATGDLEGIPPAELTADQIVQYGEARRPLFEIWAETKRDLDIELYTLSPETLTGRRTVVDRE